MYNVGQVLYTILQKQQQILPIKVVEQVTKKTLEGEKTEFFVKIPTNKKSENFNLNDFNNVYLSLEEVKNKLLENAITSIEAMVSKTIVLQEKHFEAKEKEELVVKTQDENLSCNNENNHVKIDLGNGQIANLNINNLNSIEEDQKKT